MLRFLGLDRFPLSPGEADIALSAHNLVHGAGTSDRLHGMAFAVEWTALFLFGGGSSDSAARLAMAVAGVLAVVAIARLGRWITPPAAAAAAVLAALSPTLVAASRRVDGGMLLVALSLAVTGSLLLASERASLAWPALAGVATALLVVSDPLGLPAAILAWLAVYLLRRPDRLPGRDALLAGASAAILSTVLTTTVFLSKPSGFSDSLGETLRRLWDDHLVDAGTRFYMPAFNLVLNEPLLIVLSIVAFYASHERVVVRALGVWFIEALVLVSLLDDVGVPGYALTVAPLALLAGLGAAHLVQRIPWYELRRGPAAIYLVAVLLAGAAALSVFGLLTAGNTTDRTDWLLRFGLVVGVAILPLALTISWVGARLVGDRAVVVLSAALIVIAAISLRSAVLAASERPAVPGDPLSTGASGSDIPIVIGRVERISRDLTGTIRDSQDPTGGHSLSIAIDRSVAQPFEWYFRDYVNITVFDPAISAPPDTAQIVILDGGRDARTVAPAWRGQPYLYQYDRPEFYGSPDWQAIVGGIISPDDWRSFVNFLLDRKFSTEPAHHDFQLLATGEIASRLFPSSGPYNLDDRAGAGDADGQFNRPRGIAVAPDGSIYVVDARNLRVQKFAPDGTWLATFGSEGSGPGQFARFTGAGGGGPGGIAIDPDGNLYVADTWNHRIEVFTSDGVFLRAWGSFFDAQNDPNAVNASPGQFYGPRGIAFHDGLVYVTDTGNERVQVFSPDGTFVRQWGTAGSGSGQLLEPVGIAIAADGTVLVADSHNARIARFSPDGTPLDPWPVDAWVNLTFFEPYIAIANDGRVYASTSPSGIIVAFAPDGTPLPPLQSAELRQPYGLAIGPEGTTLLVTDATINAVGRLLLPAQ